MPVGGHRVCFAIISQAHSRFLVCSNLLAPFRYRIYLTQRKNNAVAVFILLQSVRQLKNRYLASVVTVRLCSWPWENNPTLLHHCVRVGREISFPRTWYNWRHSPPSYLLPVSLFIWTMNNICSLSPLTAHLSQPTLMPPISACCVCVCVCGPNVCCCRETSVCWIDKKTESIVFPQGSTLPFLVC